MKLETLKILQAFQETRQSVALVRDLASTAQALVRESGPITLAQSLEIPSELLPAILQAISEERNQRLSVPHSDKGWFIQVFTPARWLVLVGAVHIAQALVPMAVLAGYKVTLIDPRGGFATPERFPSNIILHEWPDEALERLKPDRHTSLVTLTHDPKLDDPALIVGLRSQASYIGALGSRRTHAQRLARLREAGFDAADLARIHAPVGLAIGAKSPAEIALSILAEITQKRHHNTNPNKPQAFDVSVGIVT